MKHKTIFVTIFSVLVVVALAFGAPGSSNEGVARVSGSSSSVDQSLLNSMDSLQTRIGVLERTVSTYHSNSSSVQTGGVNTGQIGGVIGEISERVVCSEDVECLSSGGGWVTGIGSSADQIGAGQYALSSCNAALAATTELINSCLQEALTICNNSGPGCTYDASFSGYSQVQECKVTGCVTNAGFPPTYTCTADGNAGIIVATCNASEG